MARRGLLEMREAGAGTMAQDEETSVVWGMPKEAVKLGGVDRILPLDRIAKEVMGWSPIARVPSEDRGRSCRPVLGQNRAAALAAEPLPASCFPARRALSVLVSIHDPHTDPVVAAVATPDGTCEVLIPKDRYDPFAVLAMMEGGGRTPSPTAYGGTPVYCRSFWGAWRGDPG